MSFEIKFRFTISYQGEVISLLFEAGAALFVEAHGQDERLPLAQRNIEPLARLVLDVEVAGGGEEVGVVPLVAFNALSALNRVASFRFKNIYFLQVL